MSTFCSGRLVPLSQPALSRLCIKMGVRRVFRELGLGTRDAGLEDFVELEA